MPAAFSLIIIQFGGLRTYLASVQRLGTLWKQLDEHDNEEDRIADEAKNVPNEDSRTLVKELSFELHANESLMIMDPGGTGKSSILRTIAGLWYGGSGLLERPAFAHLMFLPQRPYMVEGSLREHLLYPYPERGVSDEEIRQVVADVNLSDVLACVDGDLDRVLDWGNVLSLGEQQQIAFARLFLRKPKFAFLDEATSALDEENQDDLYRRIKESKISFISVGHRTTSIQYHDRLLHLDRSGSWEIRSGVSSGVT